MFEMKHDPAADAIYITLDSDQYNYGRDLDDRRRVDYSNNNQPIGIELLSVSKGVNISNLPYSDIITKLLGKSGFKTYEIIHSYGQPMTGITNVTLDILLGPDTRSYNDRMGIKKELTGVS